MRVVNALIWRYFKLNKKRTTITLISLLMAVTLFTALASGFDWAYNIMRETEIEKEGSWHVQYHGLTQAQYEKLRTIKEIEKLELLQKEDATVDVQGEMEWVGTDIFKVTQNIGKNIGMTALTDMGRNEERLPNGEVATYDVSYHMELLEFYGITYGEGVNFSIKTLFIMLLLLIMLICAIFIYNAFAVSYIEKRKYLGLLACARATKKQKRWFVLGEGIFLGFLSVPVGIIFGLLGMSSLVQLVDSQIYKMTGLQQKIDMAVNPKVVAGAALLGFVMILLSCLVPVIKAGKISIKDLLNDYGESTGKNTRLGKFNNKFSIESNLAVKNLLFNQKRTVMIVLLIAFVVAFALNGYVYSNLQNGYYSLQDRREREEPDVWITLHSEQEEILKKISEEISKISDVKEATYIRELNLGGMLIESKHIKKELSNFRVYGYGIENPVEVKELENISGEQYGFMGQVIALEDSVFQEYAKKLGIDKEIIDESVYPTIMSDYIPIKRGDGSKPVYQNVLNISKLTTIKTTYGKYGDMIIGGQMIIVGGVGQIELDALVSTEQVPSIPKRPTEIASQINGYVQHNTSGITLYIPSSKFSNLIKDKRFSTIHEAVPNAEIENSYIYDDDKEILNYIYLQKEEGVTDAILKERLTEMMKEYKLIPYSEAYASSKKSISNTWEYSSVESIEQASMWNPVRWMKKLFLNIAIIIVSAFALSCLINYIMTSVILRKREFCVLKSVGMKQKLLKRMVLYEVWIQVILGTAIGIFFGGVLIGSQFYKFSQTSAIEIILPVKFLLYEIGILIISLVFITIYAMKKLDGFNIIEAIKNENV